MLPSSSYVYDAAKLGHQLGHHDTIMGHLNIMWVVIGMSV